MDLPSIIQRVENVNPSSLFRYIRDIFFNRYKKLTIVLFGALIFRLLLIDRIPVNYDTGLYLSDALQTTKGEVPIVDFFSRSPWFHYLLSLGLYLGFSPLLTGRVLMILLSVAIGATIYLLANRLHSERAGLFASVVFLFTPLGIIWGTWIKTEVMASLIGMLGLLVFLPKIDDPTLKPKHGIFFGGLLGLGFLVRRVLILHVVAMCLFVVFYRRKEHGETIAACKVAGATIGAMMGAILLSYFLLAKGNTNVTVQLIDYHFLKLLPGDFQIVSSSDNSIAGAGIGEAMLLFCNGCSERTVIITLQIALVTLPALLAGWVYFQSLLFDQDFSSYHVRIQAGLLLFALSAFVLVVGVYYDFMFGSFIALSTLLGLGLVFILIDPLMVHVDPITDQLIPENPGKHVLGKTITGLVLLLGWGGLYVTSYPSDLHITTKVFPRPYLVISLIIVAGVTFVVLSGLLPAVRPSTIRTPALTALFVMMSAIWFGHLFRDNIVFVGYFQDVFPYFVLFAGIGLADVFDRLRDADWLQKSIYLLLIFCAVLSLSVAPYINARHGATERPYDPSSGTVSSVSGIGSDIDKRTSPGETVFTAQPLYHLESHAENWNQFSREYWFFRWEPYNQITNGTAEELNTALASGDVSHVLWESRTHNILENRKDVREVFRNNYCRVGEEGPEYRTLEVRLYKYSEDAPNCP